MVGKSSWKRRARAESAKASLRDVARALLLQQDVATNDDNEVASNGEQ